MIIAFVDFSNTKGHLQVCPVQPVDVRTALNGSVSAVCSVCFSMRRCASTLSMYKNKAS